MVGGGSWLQKARVVDGGELGSTGGRTASVVQGGVGAWGRQKYIFMLEPCAGPRCNRDDNEYKDVIIKVGNNQM